METMMVKFTTALIVLMIKRTKAVVEYTEPVELLLTTKNIVAGSFNLSTVENNL